ncbi:MAG: ATP-binding cassette domain-containing protein [Chloroflexota bacterium]
MTAPALPGPDALADPALAIATRGLTKRYGKRQALAGIDLDVPQGRIYGFLGPNGSGKTTTLRILVGLIRPDAGRVAVLGAPWDWHDRRRLFRIGSMIETPAFTPYLSARDNLRTYAAAGPPTPRTRVEEVLDAVGLRDRAGDAVKGYSLGMRQRLGIAVALLSDPELLLLDEPANGLDPAGIVAMRELLRGLTAAGKTVVISSHILSEIEVIADVVGIVDHGRIIRQGPLAAILAEGATLRVLVAPDERERALAALVQIAPVRPEPPGGDPGAVHVRLAPERAAEVTHCLAGAGIWLRGLAAQNDLESVFLSLTAEAPTGHLASGWGMAPPGDRR